jgi:hypothetical protein
MLRRIALVLAIVAFAACGFELAAPSPDLDGLPAGLAIDFALEPAEIAPGGPFTARLSVTNTTSDTITILTGHGCLVLPNVVRGGERYPFKGTDWGCTAAITGHVFAPGETKRRTWEMSAALYAEDPGDVEGAPAPKGDYLVQAIFGTAPADESGRRPTVQAALRVK